MTSKKPICLNIKNIVVIKVRPNLSNVERIKFCINKNPLKNKKKKNLRPTC